MHKNRISAGFTLIELLVVIAIIGILSAVVLASLGTARDNARDASAQESMSNVRTQNEIHFNQNNTYDGACDADENAPTNALLVAAGNQTGGTAADCVEADDNGTWVAYVTLNTDRIYCVDSNGFGGLLPEGDNPLIVTTTEVSCQ